MASSTQPTMLIVLDGFGYREQKKYNAIALAKTPVLDLLLKEYPHALLAASGQAVGLPHGSNGNSEVGHVTLGAGRIIRQDATIISDAIKNGQFFSNPVLLEQLNECEKKSSRVHILGLLSDGGVHSDISHAIAFLQAAKKAGIKHAFVHAILDGRDVAPRSARVYLEQLERAFETLNYGTLGSLHGRFYSMDRDKNWERTALSYCCLTQAQEIRFDSWRSAITYYYNDQIFDEFIPPTQLHNDSLIKDGDAVIFFNFRPDRARQLTAPFVVPHFNEFEGKHVKLQFFMTPVSFDERFKNVVLFKKEPVKNTLMDVLEAQHKTMFAIAETEKYAHVTYFFNAGNERVHANETRVLIPSVPVESYATLPQMSAAQITSAVIDSLKKDPKDFYLINYANADMVGHSGNLEATIKAVECLDEQLGIVYKQVVLTMNGTLYITADHGNAEEMFDETTHQPKTSHTTNPVIFLVVKKDLAGQKLPCPSMKGLSDVAPCILHMMQLPIPDEMKK